MRCVFVLDLFNGEVVHAVRGERSRYGPVHRVSQVVSTSAPLALLDEVRPREVYLADLNRITGQGDNLALVGQISRRAATMADIGVRDLADLEAVPSGALPVLGTETASLELISLAAAARDLVVSIDMKERRVLTPPGERSLPPLELLARLNDLPLAGVILLELDRVGTSQGIDRHFLQEAASLCRHPLILGGGVKGPEDLEGLEEIGLSGALVATAVHNGKIPLDRLR
ncbi:MAG: nickel transporter [Methanosarcinales archaeon]|nr:nickel transporter [Methanosarcinales archaeon]